MTDYPRQMVQDRLELRAAKLNENAETLPHGDEREALQHRARRMEAALHVIDEWTRSPSLRAPRQVCFG
ncbi:MAG: hypothetical protein JWL86_3552 [Rhizobium sp.]|nr:hypothetical protein [Rhizobium sp.]